MTIKPTRPAKTFDAIKDQYKSLLERLYAEKAISDDMKREARELYVEAQLLNCELASEMRMTSVERREAQGKVNAASRDDKEVIAHLQADEHRIWRRHMVTDAQYVGLCHIAKGLRDGFLF